MAYFTKGSSTQNCAGGSEGEKHCIRSGSVAFGWIDNPFNTILFVQAVKHLSAG